MVSLESDEMTAWWPNDSLTLTFYATFLNIIPTKIFGSMLHLEFDKLTAFWANDS